MVYEQCIYKDNVEYLFKNGEVIDNVEFLERFVKAATDFEDVYRIAVSESEDKLSQYYANVKKLQNLFINGIYTRKLLLDTLIMCGERL